MNKQEGIIEGYRLFNIQYGKKGDLVLSSIVAGKERDGGLIVAPRRVNEAKHFDFKYHWFPQPEITSGCPHKGDKCGFNILKYNGQLNIEVYSYFETYIARCWGWGKVIPGSRGYRCQYMYPKSILGKVGYQGIIPLSNLEGRELDLSDLWKVARLYKIQLEMELPEWIQV